MVRLGFLNIGLLIHLKKLDSEDKILPKTNYIYYQSISNIFFSFQLKERN